MLENARDALLRQSLQGEVTGPSRFALPNDMPSGGVNLNMNVPQKTPLLNIRCVWHSMMAPCWDLASDFGLELVFRSLVS